MSKVLLTDPVVPGQEIRWRVTVTNNGPSVARGVVVRDQVPAGVSNPSMSADAAGGADCPIAGGVAVCPAVELAVGGSASWTLSGTLSPDATVTPTNVVTVMGGPDPVSPTRTAVASPSNSPSPLARLSVSKVLLTDPVVPGQEIRWRVTVTNNGPSVARGVVVRDQVPAGVSGASMSADAGGASCAISNGTATCPAVELAVGASVSWTLSGTLSPDATVTPTNVVTVMGGPDPASPTRTAVASPSSSPSAVARLSVSKVLLTDPVVPGEQVQWRVTVTNNGPSRARDVVVRDTVPTGVSGASMRADGGGADCPIADGVATCPAVELAVGASSSWTLTGVLDSDATSTPANSVVVTGGPDPVSPTRTAVASPSSSPSAVARLSVAKVLLTDPVVPGQQVQWRVTVTNDGPSRARNVVVSDQVPAGVSSASMSADAGGASCPISNGTATCPAVELAVGASASWTLSGTLSPDATVTPVNAVVVTGGPDPVSPTRTAVASPSNSPSPLARLSVSKVLLTDPVVPGQEIRWRVTVTNNGPSRARDVVVKDQVPGGVEAASMKRDVDGAPCPISGGVATCPAIEMAVGSTVTYTLAGVLDSNATSTPVNSVVVTGGPDPVSPTRTAVASPTNSFSPQARLTVSKVLLTDPVVPGQDIRWRVTVTNNGPSVARSVVVTDQVPVGVSNPSMSADAEGTSCSIADDVVTCPAVELAVGSSDSWTLSGTLSPDATVTPTNVVTVTGGPDPASPTRTAVASPTNSPSPQARLTVSKVLLTDPVVPGQPVRWRVTVTNEGPSRARDVVVSDQVPVGVSNPSMSADADGAGCPVVGGVATCPAVEIAAGATLSWTLTGVLDADATSTPVNVVVVTGGPDPVTPTRTAVASPTSSPSPLARLSVSKVLLTDPVVPGQDIRWRVTVTNGGPSVARDVVVRDQVPAGVAGAVMSPDVGGGACPIVDGVATCPAVELAVGASRSWTLSGTLSPDATVTPTNTVVVTGGPDPAEPTHTAVASPTNSPSPQARLTVSKVLLTDPVVPGQQVQWRVAVTNNGPSRARDVVVRDTVPTGVSGASMRADGGGDCPIDGGVATCPAIELAAGGTVTYTLSGVLDADATVTPVNVVVVTGGPDPVSPTRTAVASPSSSPSPLARLSVSKVLLTDPVVPGQQVQWRVAVTNNGPSRARDVVVRDTVPTGVSGASMRADDGGGDCPIAEGVATCPAVEIAAGASSFWTLTGTLSPDAMVTPTNTVVVTGGPDPAEPTHTAVASPTNSPSSQARLTVSKVLLTDPVVPGQEIRWRVTVTNSGPSVARDVVVSDQVPAEVTGASMSADAGAASCPIISGVAMCPAVEIGVGQSLSWTLTGMLSPDAMVTPVNAVVVTGGPDPASPTRTAVASPSNSPSPQARLTVSKVLLTDPVVPGQEVQWRVTVTNDGPSRARQVVVRDTVPTGITNAVMRADDVGADCPIADGVATCPAVELAVGAPRSWTLSGTLNPDATATPTNMVVVTGGPDPVTPTHTAVASPSDSPSAVARLSVSKVLLTDPVVPGEQVQWRVTVTNDGPSRARDVVVADRIPAGVRDASMRVDADRTLCLIDAGVAMCPAVEIGVGQSLSWTLTGMLSPDATVTPTNTVTVTGGPDPAEPTHTAVASPSNSLSPQARLTVSKVLLTSPVIPGQRIQWRVTVTNDGPSRAREVVVRDTVPTGVADPVMAADGDGGNCAILGGVATCPAVEIGVGESLSWTLSGVLGPNVTATPVNTVTVTGGPDPVSPTRTAVASPSDLPSPVARLSVSKVLLTDPVVPGEQVQWRVTVTNDGPSRARDVVVADRIPAGVRDASMRADADGTPCPIDAGVAMCPAVEIAVGESLSWTLSGMLSPDATVTPVNSVVVTGGPDPVSPTRTAVASPTNSPSPMARLSVSKVLLTDPVVPGQQVRWRVTVTNDGPSRARGVVVTDTVPVGITDVVMRADSDGAECPIAGGVATCPAVEIAVGESSSWTLTGTLDSDATVTPTNTVVVTGGPDPITPTHTAVASPSSSPGAAARLSVSKVLLTNPVVPGEQVQWRVAVTNNGPSVARGVVVTDRVPAALSGAVMRADSDGAECPIAGGVAMCPAVEIAVGESLSWTLSGMLSPDATVTPVNSVVVTGGPDPVSPTRTAVASPTNSPSPMARLSVSKVLLTDPVVPGQQVRWRVTVTNDGPSRARGVVVRDTVPVGITDVVMRADSNGADCPISSGMAMCPAVEIAVGESLSWTLSGMLSPDATVTPVNSVVVTGGPDPVSPTRTAVASPSASPSAVARLTVAKVLLTSPVVAGRPVAWRVTVTNEGPSLAREVVVADRVPDGVTGAVMRADSDGADCPVVGGTATCPAVSIPVGTTLGWTLTGTLSPDATETPLNSVVVTGGPDPATPTRTAVASPSEPISVRHALRLDKKVSPAAPSPGDRVVYTVTARNEETGTYRGAVVVDDFGGVLGAAEYDGDARATAGRVDYAEPRLTWTLDLRPGAVETLVYGFTVRPDAGGRRMENTVGARGDGTNCPVPMPRSRRAAPAAAGRVDAGCATDITVNPPSPSPTPTPSPSQSPSPSPSPSVSASPKPSPTRTGPPLPETGGNGGLPAGLAALVAVALLCSGGALLALRRGRR
ncbi:hypothetical protein ACIRBX_35190 [Kitasatospora sp. NPDC096147]|uniref:DUF7927 domain-containing protein n=1 Tax=Kitasatospora sp. NPDC096147 TaxID=3364093 RepID=UPI00381DAB20